MLVKVPGSTALHPQPDPPSGKTLQISTCPEQTRTATDSRAAAGISHEKWLLREGTTCKSLVQATPSSIFSSQWCFDLISFVINRILRPVIDFRSSGGTRRKDFITCVESTNRKHLPPTK